tara:strand:- start:8059 stop:8307 length:249 start_codon:yes stop_codon:yes gene_type:complete
MKIDKGVPIPNNHERKNSSKFTKIVARMEPGDSVGDFSTSVEAVGLAAIIRRHRRKKATVRREKGKKTYRVWMLDQEFTGKR